MLSKIMSKMLRYWYYEWCGKAHTTPRKLHEKAFWLTAKEMSCKTLDYCENKALWWCALFTILAMLNQFGDATLVKRGQRCWDSDIKNVGQSTYNIIKVFIFVLEQCRKCKVVPLISYNIEKTSWENISIN